MNNRTLFMLFFVVVAPLFIQSFSLETEKKPVKNITVIGTVFCDACSNNTFSKHSYFLRGAKVHVECKLKSNSKPNGEISITVDRTTDRFGVYKLEIPPVDGFDCTEGQEPESFCRATLVSSSSSSCDVPGIRSSAEHIALKNEGTSACLYNLNALSYRPAKKDPTSCGTKLIAGTDISSNACLFFWPPFPPFGFPWPQWPPFPFPPLFPSPPLLPFPPLFPSPPSLPFPFPPIPFFTPPPPSFPFPLPPLWPTPNPPPAFPFPPLPPLPPVPSIFPSPPPPPPPSFPFPIPPLPPLGPIPFPPLLPPFTPIFPPPLPLPPPPPPPPSFPFLPPLPPLFPTPSSPQPPPPPAAFSWTDPRTWFPDNPPSSSLNQP